VRNTEFLKSAFALKPPRSRGQVRRFVSPLLVATVGCRNLGSRKTGACRCEKSDGLKHPKPRRDRKSSIYDFDMFCYMISGDNGGAMTVVENGKKQGITSNSNFIPMGTFGLLIGGKHERKFLQSSGFGSCIGLVMHNKLQNTAVLAHFMSNNGVLDSIMAISLQLEAFDISIKNRNWSFVVFLGGQAKAVKKKESVTTSSALVDIPTKKVSSGPSTVQGGIDIAINLTSLENAEKRAVEIRDHFQSMSAEIQYIETGWESCDFSLETGVLQLFSATIFGRNNDTAAKQKKGKALLFDSTQMN
jgi:hypothetical protein